MSVSARTVLVVDDELPALHGTQRLLRSRGFEQVEGISDPREVERRLAAGDVRLVLLDLLMPHIDGERLLQSILTTHPALPVVVVTAEDDVRKAIRCIKAGAVDYLVKPVVPEQLIATIEVALEHSALLFEADHLRQSFLVDPVDRPPAFASIVTADPKMLRLFAYLEAISRSHHPVLIVGETGTGQELLARALHETSGRAGPFVAVNVAGLDDTVFADTLFGHVRGAYTGADRDRAGLVEAAAKGTLFLDEIGDLSEASQVKLLRLLQEGEYYALGSDRRLRLDARIVAATHRDPKRLRPDLYFRLRSYLAQVPPLRERPDDLELLADLFVRQAAADLGKTPPQVPRELFTYLRNLELPGNVRELQALLFDAAARSMGPVLSLEGIVAQLAPEVRAAATSVARIEFPDPMPTMRRIQEEAIAETLRRVAGNQSAAARLLGISRPTIAAHKPAQG